MTKNERIRSELLKKRTSEKTAKEVGRKKQEQATFSYKPAKKQ